MNGTLSRLKQPEEHLRVSRRRIKLQSNTTEMMFSWSRSGSDGVQETSSSVLPTQQLVQAMRLNVELHGTDGSAGFYEHQLGNLVRGHFIGEEPSAVDV